MTEAHQSASLTLGALRIDLDAGIVYGARGPSGLKPRAEALLILLCRHANTLVTREQILDTVWAGRVVEDSVISNTISQIRKALGEDAKDAIETRARRGYLLVLREPRPAEPASDAPLAEAQTEADAAGTQREAPLQPQHPPQPHAADPRPTRRRGAALAFAAAALLALASLAVWAWWSRPGRADAPPALGADVEMTASILGPAELDWLRKALLRETVEQAFQRDADVVVFAKALRRRVFLGPHLQVEIQPATPGTVVASIRLMHAGGEARHRFEGAETRLPFELRGFLEAQLPPPTRPHGPALEAYAAGKVAELHYDDQSAIVDYQRAIARDPRMTRAKLALAQRHSEQGRLRRAAEIAAQLQADESVDAPSRCQAQTLLADIASAQLRGAVCPAAEMLLGIDQLQTRERLARIGERAPSSQHPNDWFTDRYFAIYAHLNAWELAQARSEIAQAQALAETVGWDSARIELAAAAAEVAYAQDDTERATAMLRDLAEDARRIGDIDASLNFRAQSLNTAVPAPGAQFEANRRQLQQIATQAHARGAVHAEFNARFNLLRYLEDDPKAWRLESASTQALLDANYTQDLYLNRSLYLLDELRYQRAYRPTLEGLAKIEAAGPMVPFNQAWYLSLKMQSHFALDELDAAVAAVERMEKSAFKLEDATDFCVLAWVFVEADRLERARNFIKKCGDAERGRQRQATRGDYGLLAQARMWQRSGQSARAWAVLRPRIEALLARSDRSRSETEILTVLARHAVGLAEADNALLRRVLADAQAMAGREGAGPGVRFGAHLLAWRLCALERGDCGPVLPEWATEDRLEARLAEQMRASRASNPP